MTWLFPSIAATLVGSLILCLTYLGLYYQDREKALLIWGAGWALYTLRFVFMLFLVSPVLDEFSSFLLAANQLANLFSGVILLWGTYVFVNRSIPVTWLYISLLLVPWTVYTVFSQAPFAWISLPNCFFLGLVYIVTGLLFYRQTEIRGSGRVITSFAFILWGIHKMDYPFVRPVLWFAPWGYLLGASLSIVVAIGMLLIYLQTIRHALEKAQERYKLAIRGSSDGLWDWPDIDRDTVWWSPRLYEMLGYNPGEIEPGRSTREEIIHPADRDRVDKALHQHLIDNEPYDVELRLQTKSGEYRWFRERGQSLRDGGSGPVRMSGSIQDIHQRKVAEEALIRNENKYRRLLESTRAVPWELDLATDQITYLGPRFYEITGYRPEEIKNFNDWAATLHPDDRDVAVNFCRNSSAQCQDHDFMYRTVDTNGEIIWIHDVVHVIAGEEGPEKLVGFMLDITELVQSEINLEKTEMEWSSAMDAMDDAVYLLDLNRRIIRANQAFYRMTGSSPDTAIGRHIVEIIHPEGEEEDRCQVCQAQERKVDTIVTMEADHPHNPSGKPMEIKVQVVHDDQGAPLSILMILHDLTNTRREQTEKEKLEAQLRQAQKMEAIGTLAGGIAHDFNNILAAIMGYAEMAEEEIPPDSPARNDLEKVLKASRRARDLVKHILTFSRQSEQELGPIQPYLVINEALKLLRASIPSTIEIQQNLDKYSGSVIADPTQIHQVIMNLCTNAVHAMEEKGGTLKVELSSITLTKDDIKDGLSKASPGPYIRLTVSDTGHGIAPAHLERIFEPYFSTKDTGKGTGMGLAVVHGIVQSHGGLITVASKPGKGTTFNLYFPETESERIAETSADEGCPTGDGKHVLFVDDEELIINIGEKILEHLCYQVTVKSSSLEALQTFKADPDSFDLVITDQTMPYMTGMELAREILSIRPGLPIILCTGYSEQVDKKKVREAGISEFMMKPIGKRELAETIHKVMQGSED